MKIVRCPICKSPVPAKSETCPLCGSVYTKFQYFRINYTKKIIMGILLLIVAFNTVGIITFNRQVRKYLNSPPQNPEEVTQLIEVYESMNFVQKYFIHYSELETIQEKTTKEPEKETAIDEMLTIYFENGSKTGNYSGEIVEGMAHGVGKFDYTLEDDTNCTYEGEFSEGKISGYGTLAFSTGYKHIGNFVNGELNGYATIYNPDGYITMQGQFVSNRLYGAGAVYDDRQNLIYEGTFANNIPQKDEYIPSCPETDFAELEANTNDYINKNIAIKGIVSDIVRIDKNTTNYVITPENHENKTFYLTHIGNSTTLSLNTGITVYGYCTGNTSYVNANNRTVRCLGFSSYYITRN